MKNEKIKIFVSYHKIGKLISNEAITPINAGRECMDENSTDFLWLKDIMIGDNTGENISKLNNIYSELTSQYWVWKNYKTLGCPD